MKKIYYCKECNKKLSGKYTRCLKCSNIYNNKKKIKDLKNKRFGKLIILRKSRIRGTKNQLKWICKCDCGKKVTILGQSLKRKLSRSCGCLYKYSGIDHYE